MGSDDTTEWIASAEVRQAFDLLLNHMTPEERGFVMCWFCSVCREYMPPGKGCVNAKREDHDDA